MIGESRPPMAFFENFTGQDAEVDVIERDSQQLAFPHDVRRKA